MKLSCCLVALLIFSITTVNTEAQVRTYTGSAPEAPDRPKPLRLWSGAAPLAQGTAPADIPTISFYPAPADKANGAAIVVCPGGGYGRLADHEGHGYAVWLNSSGVSVAVLKYRLGPKYHLELHVYETGRHGVGLAQDHPALKTWPELLANWLRARGFLNQQKISENTK